MKMAELHVDESTPIQLSVSVVVYRADPDLLGHTISTLVQSLEQVGDRARWPTTLFLIDNGAPQQPVTVPESARHASLKVRVLSGHGNVGYGRGHNLAIELASSRFHLILNPDINIEPAALNEAFSFFARTPAAGLITPWIADDQGHQQFLCRRFPTVLDLFVRGFLPRGLRAPFANRLARYELRDAIDDKNVFWDPPIVSGCFMLYRTEVLKKLGGFDPRYFLYFEDYDLSLRTHEIARVAYVPSVRVLHHGGDAARKGFTHIKLFITSAIRFFNRFGWRWL
jgi:GT2 family glycosyltransferase